MDRALTLLGRRGFTAAELVRALARDHGDQVAAGAVERCRELGLVDDAAWAADWVGRRLRRSEDGRLKLLAGLRARGVDAGVAESVLAEALGADEETLRAQRAVERWLRGHLAEAAGDGPDGRRRVLAGAARRLARLGYPAEVAESVLTAAAAELLDDLLDVSL
jgi:regulatory protein